MGAANLGHTKQDRLECVILDRVVQCSTLYKKLPRIITTPKPLHNLGLQPAKPQSGWQKSDMSTKGKYKTKQKQKAPYL
jgi:hypothetical protein